MRETKDQTIARLEKVIGEQKAELSELKKERKRLNYAVERLEKQVKNGSNQSTQEDIKRIKELEHELQITKDAEFSATETIKQNDITIQKLSAKVDRMNEYKDRMVNRCYNSKLWALIVGLYEDIDGKPTFDIDTLISNINILDGSPLAEEVKEQIKEYLSNNPRYAEALERCEPYKELALKDSEAMKFLNREMWLLLREYFTIIEKNYTETFFHSV